jgi:hypothetical protein
MSRLPIILALALVLMSASLAAADTVTPTPTATTTATPTATATPTPTATQTPTTPAVDDYPDISPKAWIAPAPHAAPVTPSDIDDLRHVTRWLFIGSIGTVVVVMEDGTTVTLTGVPTGALLPIRVTRVMATNTTASNMIALW